MSAQYPSAVKTFTTRNAGDIIQPSHVNDLQDEVNAIEAGLLNGSAPLNSSHSTMASLSVTGNSTLGSSITIGAQPYIFPASSGFTDQVLTVSSTSGTTMTLAWSYPRMQFLHAATGTDNTTSATTVDSFTVTGLTAKDALMVSYLLEEYASPTNGPVSLTNTTDGVVLALLTGSTLMSSNVQIEGQAWVRQIQAASTNTVGVSQGMASTGGRLDNFTLSNLVTAWTGTWTLALRYNGVASTAGSFRYGWTVYKVAGQ